MLFVSFVSLKFCHKGADKIRSHLMKKGLLNKSLESIKRTRLLVEAYSYSPLRNPIFTSYATLIGTSLGK